VEMGDGMVVEGTPPSTLPSPGDQSIQQKDDYRMQHSTRSATLAELQAQLRASGRPPGILDLYSKRYLVYSAHRPLWPRAWNLLQDVYMSLDILQLRVHEDRI